MGLDNICFVKAGGDELPAGSDFDLVVTFDCMHDMAFPGRTAASIRRAIAGASRATSLAPWREHYVADRDGSWRSRRRISRRLSSSAAPFTGIENSIRSTRAPYLAMSAPAISS